MLCCLHFLQQNQLRITDLANICSKRTILQSVVLSLVILFETGQLCCLYIAVTIASFICASWCANFIDCVKIGTRRNKLLCCAVYVSLRWGPLTDVWTNVDAISGHFRGVKSPFRGRLACRYWIALFCLLNMSVCIYRYADLYVDKM